MKSTHLSTQFKCRYCYRLRKEQLAQVCGCDHRFYHYSCLRKEIIGTADAKCKYCGQHFTHKRLRRYAGPKTSSFSSFAKVIAFLAIFVSFLFVTRIITLFIKSNPLWKSDKSNDHLSGHKRKHTKFDQLTAEDVCNECMSLYSDMFVETQHMLSDWKAILLQSGLSLCFTIIFFVYRSQMRPNLSGGRIVELDSPRNGFGVNAAQLKLSVKDNKAFVEILSFDE